MFPFKKPTSYIKTYSGGKIILLTGKENERKGKNQCCLSHDIKLSGLYSVLQKSSQSEH
jgi:hypothetical protein